VFGQTDLLPSLDNDVKSALQEQDAFEKWAKSEASTPIAPPPMPEPALEPSTLPTPQLGAPEDAATATSGSPLPDESSGPPASPNGAMPPPPPPGSQVPETMQNQSQPMYMVPCPLKVQYWHNDPVHNAEHRKWANSDAGRRLLDSREDLAMVYTQHMQRHDFSVVQKQALQQALSMGAAPPPPQGAALAMERSNAESGATQDVPRGQSEAVQGRGPE